MYAYLSGIRGILEGSNTLHPTKYEISESTEEYAGYNYIYLSKFGKYLIRIQSSNYLWRYFVDDNVSCSGVRIRMSDAISRRDVNYRVNSVIMKHNAYPSTGSCTIIYDHNEHNQIGYITIQQYTAYSNGEFLYDKDDINMVSVMYIGP